MLMEQAQTKGHLIFVAFYAITDTTERWLLLYCNPHKNNIKKKRLWMARSWMQLNHPQTIFDIKAALQIIQSAVLMQLVLWTVVISKIRESVIICTESIQYLIILLICDNMMVIT